MDKTLVNNLNIYLICYIMLFISSLLVISLENMDFFSTFSSVTTCINNIGPGFEVVGPVGNFSSLSDLSKLVLSFDMLAGRLELFPILMLFSKHTWKN